MSGNTDLDLQILMHDWQAPAAPQAPADQIRRYVQRRSRLLIAWAACDLLVGSAFLVFLLHRAITDPDPIEKLAMGLLAAIAAGAMAFGWWNWRGALRASAENTRTFVALSVERSRRFARNIRASWVVLLAQVAVFTPWVNHRLHGHGRTPTRQEEIFAWGLLAVMVTLALAFVLGLRAWTRRDADRFARIQRELEGDEIESD